MNWLIIILGIVVTVLDATQDEIRFHWSRIFGHWFKVGSKAEQWFNPAKSWINKYKDSKLLTFLFSRPLVFLTDFWHMLKFIKINSILAIILIQFNLQWSVWEYVVAFALLNLGWGIFYEFTLSIYGAFSDKYMKKK